MPPLVAEISTLASALDDSLDLAFVVACDDTVEFANRAAQARFALDQAATLGFAAADREIYGAALARALEGEAQRFEWGERGPAGVRAWFSASLTPLRRAGAVIGALCVSANVTALKRSDERLRRTEQLMVDTQGVAHMGIWEWDVSEPHAVWSAELYRIYGLTPDTYTPSYEAYLGMVHDDDRERVIEATNRVFHEHIPYSHDERINRPDGTMRYLHTWAFPVLDDAGVLRRLIGVCQDITDRKLAEEQANELARELERRVVDRTRTIENSMRDLEAFNAMVSHDLRAPLQVIQVSAQLIDRLLDERPADARAQLARVERAVRQMTALVDALLALARVGSSPLEQGELDLGAIARDVVADLAAAHPQREVEIAISDQLPARGDARLLRAVMQNLLENAWKYTARAERARIEVGGGHDDDGRVYFVRDNGIGFAMDDARRLFTPFVRLPGAMEFPGTGIGLATVHRILERHRGTIWAESAPGQGCTFSFRLPA